MKKCLIISGGDFSKFSQLASDNYIIACDKGYEYAIKEGIRPNLIIGDFDSYLGELPIDIEILQLNPEKDDTDTISAIKFAIGKGYKEITMTCTMGARLDHAFANIQASLYALNKKIEIKIVEDNTIIYFIKNGSIKITKQEGFSLSILSLVDKSRSVSIKNTKYILENGELTNSFPLGVSNEWGSNEAEISVEDGALMIILSKM